jgi:hypothetical protein
VEPGLLLGGVEYSGASREVEVSLEKPEVDKKIGF